MMLHLPVRAALVIAYLCLAGCVTTPILIMPEQRTIDVREPSQLPRAPIPEMPRPRTVSDPITNDPERFISLDEAIRIALENSQVVRVLAGVSAVSSGQTIYDPAISNTQIDQEQARFDPNLTVNNIWLRNEPPTAILDPLDPDGTSITGIRTDAYNLNAELTKTLITGGTAGLVVTDTRSRSQPGVFPLNPFNEWGIDLNLSQPLLQGAGVRVNLAPIVISRINTERSYFQLKGAMQDSVRGVIEAYWALVFARTDAWARRQQEEQGAEAFERAKARQRQGLGNAADVAQSQLALANFRANRIGADANVIQREAALRNILGLPPSGPMLVPTTPPSTLEIQPDWDELTRLAEERRPDLIELKLIILADEQRLLVARNQALPRVDTNFVYGWNGLEGTTLLGPKNSTSGGEFTDWNLGVNFSVPLGLRQGRAALRQQELIIARDWANLQQGMHATVHELATSTRSLAQNFEQYKAFKEARDAARTNLDQQTAEFRAGRTIFLNVLQAITDWGNSVSAEAQALAQYNAELANLERQTGTILETHGVYFFEERFGSIGPLGRLFRPRCYPSGMAPGPNAPLYPAGGEPAENSFDLKDPIKPEATPPAPVSSDSSATTR
jgi:outer membrane protein TolC